LAIAELALYNGATYLYYLSLHTLCVSLHRKAGQSPEHTLGSKPAHPRVVAVDADTGTIAGGFTFDSTNARGGDVWSSVAGRLDSNVVAVTTGNAASWNGGSQSEPKIDNSLSMLGLNATTGAINWKLRAVPFDLDMDPHWAAGPALLDTRCGHAAASTQKDGWTYAAQSDSTGGGSPKVLWQFPPTGIPFTSGTHDDTRYTKPGAAWNDTYISMDGGYEVEAGQAGSSFTRLHALHVCAPSSGPVRWIANVPDTTPCPPAVSSGQTCESQLGPPTVTGGIVFIGTATGHLIALADPSVYTSALSICSNPEVASAPMCGTGLGAGDAADSVARSSARLDFRCDQDRARARWRPGVRGRRGWPGNDAGAESVGRGGCNDFSS
jgi:hypothetical protein